MQQISVADWIQIAILGVGVLGGLLGALNRWAVSNKHDNLAMITSAAANAAGNINEIVGALPPGATAAQIKSQLIRTSASALAQEFAPQAKSIDGTADKIATIISGKIGLSGASTLVGVAENSQNTSALLAAAQGVTVVTPVAKEG